MGLCLIEDLFHLDARPVDVRPYPAVLRLSHTVKSAFSPQELGCMRMTERSLPQVSRWSPRLRHAMLPLPSRMR
jgi:hypothetical protein